LNSPAENELNGLGNGLGKGGIQFQFNAEIL